jgi:hypothetical protein
MTFNFTQPDPNQYKACTDPIVQMGPNATTSIFRALFGGRQGCQGRRREVAVHAGGLEHLAPGHRAPAQRR